MEVEANASGQTQAKTKFCKHCGGTIPQDAVMCTHCGRQVEKLAGAAQPQVVIQNTNMNTNTAAAVVAGELDFTDALKLVALRGDLMEQAYPHGYGLTKPSYISSLYIERKNFCFSAGVFLLSDEVADSL